MVNRASPSTVEIGKWAFIPPPPPPLTCGQTSLPNETSLSSDLEGRCENGN